MRHEKSTPEQLICDGMNIVLFHAENGEFDENSRKSVLKEIQEEWDKNMSYDVIFRFDMDSYRFECDTLIGA